MPTSQNDFDAVAKQDLQRVQGGASRVTSRGGSSDQLTTMMTQITSSIQSLSQNKNQSDPSMMMMMMMMMGGGGGGGAAAAAPPPPPAPAPTPAAPVVNISTRVR